MNADTRAVRDECHRRHAFGDDSMHSVTVVLVMARSVCVYFFSFYDFRGQEQRCSPPPSFVRASPGRFVARGARDGFFP